MEWLAAIRRTVAPARSAIISWVAGGIIQSSVVISVDASLERQAGAPFAAAADAAPQLRGHTLADYS